MIKQKSKRRRLKLKIIKKILSSILSIFVLNIFIIKNFVFADMIGGTVTVIEYTPAYYIAIFIVIAILVAISIIILRKIYKSNQLEKDGRNSNEIEK